MKYTALLTLAVLAAPIAAFAGGVAAPVVEPQVTAPAPVIAVVQSGDWTGLYSGVSLGFGKSFTKGIAQDGTLHIAGVNLGYRYNYGTIVVGGELSYSKDNINVGLGSRTVNNTTALKLIVGKDLGRTLVYGTVGAARADATLAGVKASDTGFSLGIGADYALTRQWTVGGALEASRFNNFNGTGVRLEDTSLVLKVGYRF